MLNSDDSLHKVVYSGKHIFLIILGAVFGLSVRAQTFFYEDFSATTMPQGWVIEPFPGQQYNPWTIDLGNFEENNAGGLTPELQFLYYLPANTTSRIIAPALDMSGHPNAILTFNYMFDHRNNGPSIGVATRTNNGPWNVVWQRSPTGNEGPVIQNIPLSNIGQPIFEFCFFVSGNLDSVDQWYIDNVRLHQPLPLDGKLFSAELPSYVATATNYTLNATFYNEGTNTVNEFELGYSINGGAPQTHTFNGLSLGLNDSVNLSFPSPLSFPSAGRYDVSVFIGRVNGNADMNLLNDTLRLTVWALPYIPRKKVLAEIVTGTWCGYCVRSKCFIEQMQTDHPDTWIGITVHDRDPMENGAYNTAIKRIIPGFLGYPTVTTDRTAGDDLPDNLEAAYQRRIAVISPATIEFRNYSWDPLSRVVSFELRSEFLAGIETELRFGLIISEDSLSGTTPGWNQSNNYSGGGLGIMCGLENLPNPIPAAQMHYNNVGRIVLDSPYGSAAGPTQIIRPGDVVTKSYSYTIPPEWNYERLKFTGFLANAQTYEVLNATDEVTAAASVTAHSAENAVQFYPNPSSGVSELLTGNDCLGSNYDVTDMSGRTYLHGQILERKTALDLTEFPSGIYLLSIHGKESRFIKLIKE